MKTIKTLALATAVSAVLFGASGVMAATQGTKGSTSTGRFDIDFKRAGEIIINDLDDISLPQTANETGDLVAWDNVCVGTTTATTYSITAVGLSDSFVLTSESKIPAPYSIHYADGITNEANTTLDDANKLTYGVTKAGYTPTSIECAEPTSTVWVKLAAANIPDQDGTYTDTVTLTVSPD